MNRIFKFRVWDKSLNRFHNEKEKSICLLNSDGKVFNFSVNRIDNDCIVQLFTGLFDKNGKEIYEGDIVKFAPFNSSIHGKGGIDYQNGTVKQSKYGRWSIEGKESYLKDMPFDNEYTRKESKFEDEEIIGNIFENPELLKS